GAIQDNHGSRGGIRGYFLTISRTIETKPVRMKALSSRRWASVETATSIGWLMNSIGSTASRSSQNVPEAMQLASSSSTGGGEIWPIVHFVAWNGRKGDPGSICTPLANTRISR